MNVAVTYVLTLVVFALIDTTWLGTMGDRLYRPLIGSMLADNFKLAPAIAFYALYAAGLTLFAVLPGLAWPRAAGRRPCSGEHCSGCSPMGPMT